MLEFLPLTEAPPRSRQESDPQPLHKITSLGSGHNKDRLRYQTTEHHPINSTDPTNNRPSTTLRSAWNKPELTRGIGASAEKEDEER